MNKNILYLMIGVLIILNLVLIIKPQTKITSITLENPPQITTYQSRYEYAETRFISYPENCSNIRNVYGVYFTKDNNFSTLVEQGINFSTPGEQGINLSEPITINVCGYALTFKNWSYLPKENLCYNTIEGNKRCWVYHGDALDEVQAP